MTPHSFTQSPKEIPYKFMEAWNQYNAQGIADLFVEDADFVNVTGKWWNSKQQIFEMHDYKNHFIIP